MFILVKKMFGEAKKYPDNPWLSGYHAYVAGVKYKDNPWGVMSNNHAFKEWRKGWKAAAETDRLMPDDMRPSKKKMLKQIEKGLVR